VNLVIWNLESQGIWNLGSGISWGASQRDTTAPMSEGSGQYDSVIRRSQIPDCQMP
jgi:hypothetical protein